MTVCKVLLLGLKPCDISSVSNNKLFDAPPQQEQSSTASTQVNPSSSTSAASMDINNLNLSIKPLVIANSSQSSLTNNNVGHELSPIRLRIRETPGGRHRICISQTLLRTHSDDT